MKRIVLFSFLIAFFFSCNISKNATYRESEFQIRFGHLGGFAALPVEYLINGDRNVFKVDLDSMVFINKITKKEFEGLHCSLQELGFETMQLNIPGNMTYFIKVKTPEYINEVKWYEYSGNSDVEELYNILLTTLE
ncbi:MAG: hypothetical protein JW798_14320 [Prolixibacteraceae bacterium]|nr:hypothetical protein [Prolixibacteraceae bacterium]